VRGFTECILEKEMVHQKCADYKSIKRVDDSQKRFIFQGSPLPECERLPAALHGLLPLVLTNSGRWENAIGNDDEHKLKPSLEKTKPSDSEVRCFSRLKICFVFQGCNASEGLFIFLLQ